MSGHDWTADPGGKVYLSDSDYRVLSVESAISDEVIAARQYQTLHRDSRGIKRLADLKIGKRFREPKTKRLPGLLIPLYRPTGGLASWQFRPLEAPPDPRRNDRRGQKYASPYGRPAVVDINPVNKDKIADPSVELWITEGAKKADCLASLDICAVSLAGVWNWRSNLGTLGDWEDVPLKGRRVVICFDSDAEQNPGIAASMRRLGAWLRSKGERAVMYVVVPRVGELDDEPRDLVAPEPPPKTGVDDFIAGGGTLDQLREAMTKQPPRPLESGDAFTDARMSETIAEDVLDGHYRWSAGLGWLAWDGKRWRESADQVVIDAVRTYVLKRFRQAVSSGAERAIIEGWYRLCSASKLRAVVGLGAGVEGVIVDAADLDGHPDLLNVANGVVDLATGELLPHDPELLMTRLAPCRYDPQATHPDWDAALTALPPEVVPWLQERYGQAISGHMTPDDRLVIQQGAGENGKTTITGGLPRVLGDYFLLVSDRVLLANPQDHPTELMDLRGVRFALIEETPEARRMNVQRLKKVCGTPQITARHIRRDSVTFNATHSLFLSSNYRPIIEETDHGTWRRLVLVSFPYRFVPEPEPLEGHHERRGDPGLRERIKHGDGGQHEAALAWLVAGAVRWYASGKVMTPPPVTVAEDTYDWRKESDLVLAYLDERLVFDTAAHVMASDLLDDVNGWLDQHGHREWSDKLLASRFGGHHEVTRHHVEKRRGIRKSPALPRPFRLPVWGATLPPPPKQYAAWLGVRFRTDDDTVGESETPRSDGVVTGVTGDLHESREP